MALPASPPLSLTPKFQTDVEQMATNYMPQLDAAQANAKQIKLCKHQPSQLQRCSVWRVPRRVSLKCSMKVKMGEIGGPNKVKGQLGTVREKLWEAVPNSVKDFPWKKAEEILLDRMFFHGWKALKWSLITLFIFSSLSDVAFSISRNQELMIPFGLLVGYLMTNFLRETLQEVFHRSKREGLQRNLLNIGCFFVLVKFMSACFALKAQLFLLHVANGGLLQVFWLSSRSSVEENDKGNEENTISNQDASLAINAED